MSRNLDKCNRKHQLGFLLLLGVAVLGVVVILVQTRLGLGTTGDSVRYLMGAQNLLDGNGYSRLSGGGEIRPITMFPPFYSVVLAGVKITGLDLYDGVRILHALLFGLNIFLVGLLILRYTRSPWAALIGSLFILVAKDLVFYHTWVLTEAVFITLMLVSIYGLIQFLENHNTYLLILLGILVGAATMTRYVGLSLTMAGAFSILVLSDVDWRKRLLDCLVFGAISVAPVLLWLRRNATLTGTSVNRSFIYHPMSTELIRAYRAKISYWFVPKQLNFPHSLRKAIMLLIGIPGPILFFLVQFRENFLRRNQPRKPFWALPWILIFFAISYVGLLFFNLTLLDAISDFNTVPRYLVPVYIAAVILFVIAFHRLTNLAGKWLFLRGAAVALGLILIILYAQDTTLILQDPLSSIGYSGLKQQRPETVEMLESIEDSAPIISNDPEMVYIFADRPAYLLPLQVDFHTTMERDDFDQQLAATREKLLRGGVVVLFSPMTENELKVVQLLDAELLDVFYGSMFYGYPDAIAE